MDIGIRSWSRRRAMQAASLACGSVLLPSGHVLVWAQSEGSLKLVSLPKIALVFGNGNYRESPLRNPVNDAKAIGDALKAAGFAVNSKLDVTRAEMAVALQAYIDELKARQCVGLFYYAGHGIQLAWRNYMLPVDARVATVEDVEKQGIDVGGLLQGLTKAANPMNVIILDACRDNPFGGLKGASQRGLAQMDAPPSTLLAFATSPGNVASDGEGANGLYTEHLVNELKVPEARVEDVFKRVRLAVRRKSNGQQIPWESTSLEEDFYFIPPASLKKASDEERDRRFKEERAVWDKARASTDAGPIEDYLRRYPSGNFSELAQLQLERVLARQGEKPVQIAAAPDNPFTKGSAVSKTDFKVGDSYTYRVLDLYSKVETRRFTTTVAQVTESEVIYNTGRITDLLGNTRKTQGWRLSDAQTVPREFAIGKGWSTRFILTLADGREQQSALNFRCVARESVTVPAGTFNAFRVECEGYSSRTRLKYTSWYAPDRLRRTVVNDSLRIEGGNTLQAEREELVSYNEA
jgi:hypothetical protein